MVKKILTYLGYLLMLLTLVAYFYLSATLTKQEEGDILCDRIEVVILDSAQNRFVSRAEIMALIGEEGIVAGESKIKSVNQHQLEETISSRTAVKLSNVSVTNGGKLRVDIIQRRPIVRIHTINGGFYMDDSAYIFPLMRSFTSFVPIISGEIPLPIPPGYRGEGDLTEKWTSGIYQLATFLDKNREWNSMIEQIYVDSRGVLFLTPRAGKTEIIFGSPNNIEYKFKKLKSFYKEVIPVKGWDEYKTVDLSFGNQLVCKKREYKQIKT